MIEAGHSFESIKSYSLGQIGLFMRSSVNLRKSRDTELMTMHRLAYHATAESFMKLVRGEETGNSPEPTKKEVEDGWAKLKKLAGRINRRG